LGRGPAPVQSYCRIRPKTRLPRAGAPPQALPRQYRRDLPGEDRQRGGVL
jgi:hypothetical protein